MASEKNLELEGLQIGMIVSQDIVNKVTGALVVRKGTILDEMSLNRLRSYYSESGDLSQVSEGLQSKKKVGNQKEKTKKYQDELILNETLSKVSQSLPSQLAYKYREEEVRKLEDEEILNGSIPTLSKNERRVFINFKNSYADTEESVKQYLNAIDNGKIIVVDEVAAMTSGIMGNLDIKSSVFTYLEYLKKRNDYTYSHSINVSLLCRIFGRWLNLRTVS